MLLPYPISRAKEPANNLLRNGSLEGTQTPFTDTSWNSGKESAGVEYVWEVGSDDKNSYLKIAKENDHLPIASWDQTFAYNSTAPALTITAKVKAVKVTKAAIDAIFLDVNGDVVRHKGIAYIGSQKKGGAPLDHDWREYSCTIAIPPASRKIRIALQNYGPGTVMFDDITAVYENDSAKIKDSLAAVATEFDHSRPTTDLSSNQIATKEAPASAQIPSGDSTVGTERFADIDQKAPSIAKADDAALDSLKNAINYHSAEPIQTRSPALSGSSNRSHEETQSTYNTQGPPLVRPSQYPTNNNLVDSRGLSNPPAVDSPNATYPAAPAIHPDLKNRGTASPSMQPNYPSTGSFASPYFAQPVPNMEIDTVRIHVVPTIKTRNLNGSQIEEITHEKQYLTSDGTQFKSEDAAKAHARTLKLTKQYHDEADPAAKAQTREDLLANVTTEYDHMRSDRVKEIEELTKKLEEIKANLDKRDAVKDKIIEKRVEQLLGVDQLYQWDNGSQSSSASTSQQWIPYQTVPGQPLLYKPAPATSPTYIKPGPSR